MAVAPLNLTPELQAWHLAGLSCLLLDEPGATLVREAREMPGARSPVPAVEPVAGPPRLRRAPAAAATAGQATEPARSVVTDREAIVAVPIDQADQVEFWPGPWRELLARMQPAPLAWTYPELGEDLLQSGNKERSAALREIISRLRLPRGSSTFWPTRLPEQERPDTPAPDYFRAGLQRLEVRFLIVFGPDALAGTAYEALKLTPFSEQLGDGRLILALPDFASLLAVPGRLDKVVLFLDSVLSKFLRA